MKTEINRLKDYLDCFEVQTLIWCAVALLPALSFYCILECF